MKTISVGVAEDDYDAFRAAAKAQSRSVAQLIREAMALFRAERLEGQSPMSELAVLAGHKSLGPPPSRAELYDEIFSRE